MRQEAWQLEAMDRRYSIPPSSAASESRHHRHRESAHHNHGHERTMTEDLHAWSIYRQNLNTDFTDSALGSSDKTPLPYGNFLLKEATVQAILNNPRYAPKSELGSNMYTYLKFGLPRVFPPNPNGGGREASSGYDSSDDGAGRGGRGGGRGSLGTGDKYTRSKSNPDLLNARDWGSPVPGEDREIRRPKSSSEANLISPEPGHRSRQGLVSKLTGSQMSLLSRQSRRSRQNGAIFNQPPEGGVYREPPMLNDKLFPRDAVWNDDGMGISGTIGPGNMSNGLTGTKGPHLQVRGLVYDNRANKERSHLLDGISFEVRGGEILAVMATEENEGTCLLDCLGGRHTRWGGRLRGDFLLNGNLVSSTKLSSRTAYVQQDVQFCPDTSVRQTMLLHAFLRESGDHTRGRNVKARINALIEDLGLEQVKHTRVLDLTLSEKRRLNVACHLLLETDIVLLDQPTRGMDIFDTFFLVEYLRQWAGRGRIVILTIQPPTYEIFTMISRILLVSTGRVMYFGRRREMLPYFAFIEYPCPAYKNPSDYYIDLVTLDDLSSEAMLESSQRVEMLADTFRRRQEALSDPGPPCALPPRIRTANPCITLLALWIRAMIYQFPYNLLQWLGRSVVAALMSVFVGLVFWDTRSGVVQQQEGINNRVGFYYVLSVVAVWPMLLMTVSEVWRDKAAVIRDVRDGLYSRTVYIITKMLYSFLAVAGTFVSYSLPAYTMAGFEPTDGDAKFYSYVGHMLVYLFAVNTLAVAVATLIASRHTAAAVTAFIATVAALGTGYTVHPEELSQWTWPTLWWSPPRWLLRELVHSDLSDARDFACDRNPVMKDLQSIIQRKVSCGVVNGQQALRFLGLDEAYLPGKYYPALLIFCFYVFWLLVALLAFIFVARTPTKKKYHIE